MDRLGAAVMLAVVGYCVLRLLVSRWTPVDGGLTAAGHTTMALVMAGMFAPALMLPVSTAVTGAFFAGLALVFLVARARCGTSLAGRGHRDHAVGALAMGFMLAPTAQVPGGLLDVVAVLFVGVLALSSAQWAGRAVACARRLASAEPRLGLAGWALAPVGLMCCDAVMAVTMALMIYRTG